MARTQNTESPKTTRPRKTAAQKAQTDLDAAVKSRDAVKAKLEKAEPAVITLRSELEQAERLVNFLAGNPLLESNQQVSEPTEEQPATLTPTNGEQG